jgi:hypothetical protein
MDLNQALSQIPATDVGKRNYMARATFQWSNEKRNILFVNSAHKIQVPVITRAQFE